VNAAAGPNLRAVAYLAYFATLPGCQTWGDTCEAAVRNAEEAVAVYIETLIANGDPVPEPELSASPTALASSGSVSPLSIRSAITRSANDTACVLASASVFP